MSNQEFDSLLRHIVVDSIKSYTEQFSNNDLLFLPSAGYGRQVRLMLSNPLGWAKRRTFPIWKKTLRAVAMIFIAIFVTIGCLITFSSPVRATVRRWMQEIYDKYISYRYVGEQEDFEMKDYEITLLPDGYKESERNKFPSLGIVIYGNESDKFIYFRYINMEQGSLSVVVTDGIEPIDVSINSIEGKYWKASTPDSMSTLMWMDYDVNLQFTIDAELPFSDILHMAESVNLCKYTK